jgi:transcriptional regulator with XRE-family HTH domain
MKPETERIIQVLRTSMRVLGHTNRDIERKLGVSGGYLTRLFSGVMELRFEHIVDIAHAIGLETEEVFQLAYPQPRKPPTESAQRIREAFGTAPLETAPAFVSPDDSNPGHVLEQEMERMMMRTFRKFFAEMAKNG